jgi:hypothetical protein
MEEVQRLLENRRETCKELERYQNQLGNQLETYDSELASLWIPYLEGKGFRRIYGTDLKRCSPAWEMDLEKNPLHVGEINDKKYIARHRSFSNQSSSFFLYERTTEKLNKAVFGIDHNVTAEQTKKKLLYYSIGGSLVGAGIGYLFNPLVSLPGGFVGAEIGWISAFLSEISKRNYGTKWIFSERSPHLAMENLEKILGGGNRC